MPRLVLPAVLAALVLAAPAGALTPPAPVTALAAAGGRIAYATAWTPRSCERVATVGAWSYAPRLCPALSTGRGVAAIAVSGKRTLWLSYAGGNIREWSLLTATRAAPRPRLLRFVAQDVDLPAPIVVGPAGSSLLPYAVGRDVVVLRPSGARAFTWTAPARVVALSASGSVVVVAQADGRVSLVSGGRETSSQQFGGPPLAAFAANGALVVQVGPALELRAPATARTWALPAGAQLEGANAAGLAVYVVRGRVHLLDLSSGGDRSIGPGTQARLDGGRLVVATAGRIRLIAAE